MNSTTYISAVERLVKVRKALQRNVLSLSSLHVGQPAMLCYVQENPGCSQKQMADEAHVTPASIAASFKRLERTGLISRRADKADTRCNRVYITNAGERELNYCQKELSQIDETMIAGISEQELSCFEEIIQKMIFNLENQMKNK